jgi:hypothetical protein
MCFVAFGLADRITIGTLMGQELWLILINSEN